MAIIAPRGKVGSTPVTGVMGELGGVIITGTSATTGDFGAIVFYETSVISSITLPDFTGSLNGETISAGSVLYGKVTSITLTSGACIAYNRTSSME
jgi:hypothetical protein